MPPIDLSDSYALSLSTQQLVGILLIVFLTWLNTRGIQLGKLIQNTFTSAKTLSLLALIVLGILVGRNAEAIAANFTDFWAPANAATDPAGPARRAGRSAASQGLLGLFVAFCVAQVGSLFSADAWNNITFTAGEVKNPAARRSRFRSPPAPAGDRALRAGQRGLSLHPAARGDPDRARTTGWPPPP